MTDNAMQCKDIPDVPVLEFLENRKLSQLPFPGAPGTLLVRNDGSLFANSVQHAMPATAPLKLMRAKMASLIKRKLVNGCVCGCRGDFELTDKGRAHLAAARAASA
jgi:hypothetical protein